MKGLGKWFAEEAKRREQEEELDQDLLEKCRKFAEQQEKKLRDANEAKSEAEKREADWH